MQFHLSEERIAIQDAVRGTLARLWPMEKMHAFADGDAGMDRDSFQALMALGIGDTMLPDSGMGLLDAALVCETAGEAAAAVPLIGQLLAVAAVAASSSGARSELLTGLRGGQTVAALVHGDSEFVPCGLAADMFLLVDRKSGVRLVPAAETNTETVGKSTDRTRPAARVRIPSTAGVQLFAASDAMTARLADAALVLVAADALGGAQKVTDWSVAYAKQREQFGQPIGQFQGLKHQLAHMALDVEPARALVWYAAYAWDAQLEDGPRTAAIAKAHVCEVYVRATRAAVAAHGGIGYTWEYGLGYWVRRALVDQAWLGGSAAHRARAAALTGW